MQTAPHIMDYFKKTGVYIQYWAPYTYLWEVVSEQAELAAKYLPITATQR